MGGAGGDDIFDIDMPRLDIPKQKRNLSFSILTCSYGS